MSTRRALRDLRRSLLNRLLGRRDRASSQLRRGLYRLLQGHAEAVTVERDGLVWTLPVGEDPVPRSLFARGAHHEREVQAVVDWLDRRGWLPPERSWIVDVGAHIGTPALPLARLTGRRILAIEPLPESFALLVRNVAQNGLEGRIDCVQAAVSRARRELEMFPGPVPSSAEVRSVSGRQGFGTEVDRGTPVRVPGLPLAEILAARGAAPEQVALVWSDTQGCEAEVLASGTALWERGAPAYVELWTDGLRAHGGLETFAELATASFDRFLLRAELLRRGAAAEPAPIDGLPGLLPRLERHTDALLLPRGR